MVYTDGIDKLDYDLLYSLIPQDAVNVEYTSDVVADDVTYTISPGDKLGLNSSMTNYGTVAGGVKWGSSNTYGIMTAGHMGDLGTTVYYNGTNIGNITSKKQSGSIDVALISKGQTSDTINLSKVVDGKSLDYNGGTWPENTPITAYGATTGISTGKITDTDYANTFSGINFTGLVYTTATSTDGDSGAPIITPYSESYSMIGVNKGSVGGDLVYTDMQKIKDWFTLNLVSD
ncbi:MAG TPA: hypothetical protein VJ888_05645 [Mobilitalea sp.]|nr:hypothetical protein [Mobilitalea sp.]